MSSSSAVVSALLAWLGANGAPPSPRLEIRYLGQDEGHGVFAAEPLAAGRDATHSHCIAVAVLTHFTVI